MITWQHKMNLTKTWEHRAWVVAIPRPHRTRCALLLLGIIGTGWFTLAPCVALEAATIESEICVFGGTSAGIAAAVQARRMGKTAGIVEPGKYPGGMTTGGLGAEDIGNKAAIGGPARGVFSPPR